MDMLNEKRLDGRLMG